MAVNRQVNFLGQQRVDVPHIRALESAVCYDFDAVGLMVTAGVPCVVNGFNVVNYATAVGSLVSQLVLSTAGGRIIHPLASDSGSFFQVPANRANEVISANNPRVIGAWTPGTVNYLGVDLLRTADTSTATSVRFLTTNPDTETTKTVPLARTMDYVFTISTTPFSVTPSICPVLIVTTDVRNTITVIKDARNLLFRLGAGGDSPSSNNPFGWPGGRNEGTGSLVAGDRSITSLKQWMSATMTRLQEIGGGEYWYSLTADRNVRMTQEGVFVSNGESFEWDETNLHWQGIRFLFDNSTSYINEVANQTGSRPGLTDLLDGECIYVDLDRAVVHTIWGNNPLVAQKAALASLSGAATPGQRWVIASRIGSKIFVRDQSWPVGSAFKLASISAAGMIRTTINHNGDIPDPVAVGLADSIGAYYTATCGGISHNTDVGGILASIGAGGDIVIGRGSAAGDGSVFIQSNTEAKPVVLYGKTNFDSSQSPAVKIIQGTYTSSSAGRIVEFGVGTLGLASVADSSGTVASINEDGSIGLATADYVPVPGSTRVLPPDEIVNKIFFRTDKTYLHKVDAIFGTGEGLFDGWISGPTGTWTSPTNRVLTSMELNGVTPSNGLRVLAQIPVTTNPQVLHGTYTITSIGSTSSKVILTKDTTPLFNGAMVYNNASVGAFSKTFLKIITPDPIVSGTTPILFVPTGPDIRTLQYLMWPDGTTTPIAQSQPRIVIP
jgi:hypothetical protein